jgi:hypothetical protein
MTPFVRPLVTARAPVNGTLADAPAGSNSYLHAPAAVVVGRSSSPQATGTLANVDAPVTASGSGGSSASLPQVTTAQSGGSPAGAGSTSSSLINVVAPVQVPTTGSASPVPAIG